MINKIIASFFFIELLIALFIAVYWVNNGIETHTLKLSTSFLAFLNQSSADLSNFKIEIPDIPKIDTILSLDDMESAGWWNNVLNFFVNFGNAFFNFLNGVIVVLNFIIDVLNYIIQFLEFIGILFKNLFTLITQLQNQPIDSSSVV